MRDEVGDPFGGDDHPGGEQRALPLDDRREAAREDHHDASAGPVLGAAAERAVGVALVLREPIEEHAPDDPVREEPAVAFVARAPEVPLPVGDDHT